VEVPDLEGLGLKTTQQVEDPAVLQPDLVVQKPA
jgi:hypothetical protein